MGVPGFVDTNMISPLMDMLSKGSAKVKDVAFTLLLVGTRQVSRKRPHFTHLILFFLEPAQVLVESMPELFEVEMKELYHMIGNADERIGKLSCLSVSSFAPKYFFSDVL
jgi:hypothetical protein